MKRANLDLTNENDVNEYLDYVEQHVTDIRDLIKIECVEDLVNIGNAYLIAEKLSDELY